MAESKMFPIQAERGAAPHPLLIPWSVAELAYSVYAGRYGKSQSLARLAERGGFGPGEMDMFLPGWRDRCDELVSLRSIVAKLPKTADGVPIVPGMKLYPLHPLDDDDEDCVVVAFKGADGGEEYDTSVCPPECNYSSPEAATAARETVETSRPF